MAKSDFWFHYPIRVRYADVDAQGIVFFVNYLTYLDTAHSEYMRILSFDYRDYVERHDHTTHIVKSVVEYHTPARLDDQLDTCVRTSYIGRSSMRFDFEIHLAETGTLICTAQIVVVHTDRANMKPTPWPEHLVEAIIEREIVPVERP